ncbi:MAG TPA: ATP-dependent zinc metalloprotease FtsH [Acidimicrobiales bacterium]|nr:ATP-dependent zinc metalloprotease FtsH [Acidimicrobiales bacterium]
MAARPPTNDAPDRPDRPDRPPRSLATRIGLAVMWTVMIGGFVALVVVGAHGSSTPAPSTISYSKFLADVSAGSVKSVDIAQSSGVIDGELENGKTFTAQGPPGGMPSGDIALLDRHHVARDYSPPTSDLWPTILTLLVPIGLIALFWVWSSRRMRGQMGAIGALDNWSKSKAKVHVTEASSTTFADIAGYDSVKQEIHELVEFLTDPGRFRDMGARVPKGVLLVGPPGTGKTLFARALAGEAGVPFITITGSEFMEMFVGVGAARVRDLFETARRQKPSIIFIDEIDAIGRKRGTGLGGGHDEREQTLNQILSEMDGFDKEESIIVMAATNRPDVLDPALLRAGRFDRQIVVPLPTLEERRAILEVHARGKRTAADVDLDTLARGTPGMSGADLENLMNEAALIAVRRASAEITQADIEAARERVLLGLRRTSLALSPEEKKIVAYHEAGHTLLAELLPHADPVHKVSILPTGMALGVTQQLPDEERQLQQRPHLDDALAVRLGGRASEELVFGVASTGAADDLTSATELAGRMVREWGMSDAIGEMAFGPRGPVFLGEELVHSREYSDETARAIDEEITRMLDAQAARARQVLSEHRAALDAVATALEERESLDGAEVEQLIVDAEHPVARLPGPGPGPETAAKAGVEVGAEAEAGAGAEAKAGVEVGVEPAAPAARPGGASAGHGP